MSLAKHSFEIDNPPLVSCIMLTHNRSMYVRQAIRCFLRQDYPHRQLVIVDDGNQSVGALVPNDPSIHYVRLEHEHTIGAARNIGCQVATGEIVAHWDDDDWSASWRLSYQVISLLRKQADICGLDRVLYYDPWAERAWQYEYPGGPRTWVAGNTFCYARAFWLSTAFPNISVGEDNQFLWSIQSAKVLPLQNNSFFVALIHPGNVSTKRPTGHRWCLWSTAMVQKLMGSDWAIYANFPNAIHDTT